MESNIVPRQKNTEFDKDFKLASSAEARICTECPLPASACKGRCERYEREKRRLRGK